MIPKFLAWAVAYMVIPFLELQNAGGLNEFMLIMALKMCSLRVGQKTISGEVLTGLLWDLCALRSVPCPSQRRSESQRA